jgi:phosphate transport system substrate-binding protein
MAENEAAYNFMEYTIENAGEMADAVGYVAAPQEEYDKDMQELEALKK